MSDSVDYLLPALEEVKDAVDDVVDSHERREKELLDVLYWMQQRDDVHSTFMCKKLMDLITSIRLQAEEAIQRRDNSKNPTEQAYLEGLARGLLLAHEVLNLEVKDLALDLRDLSAKRLNSSTDKT